MFAPFVARANPPEQPPFEFRLITEQEKEQQKQLIEDLKKQALIEYKKQKEKEYKQSLITKAERLKGKYQGQCVVAVRNFLGVGRDQIQGMAKSTKINSREPKIGSIIVLAMSKAGHVGVILDDQGERLMYFDSNGDWRQRGAIRYINKNDPRIRGYRIINS